MFWVIFRDLDQIMVVQEGASKKGICACDIIPAEDKAAVSALSPQSEQGGLFTAG